MSRGAKILNRDFLIEKNSAIFSATHDGLGGKLSKVLHKRDISISENCLVVSDSLSKKIKNELHFYLHPKVLITNVKPGKINLMLQSHQITLEHCKSMYLEVQDLLLLP